MQLRSVLLLDFDNLLVALDRERGAAAKRFVLDPQGWVAALAEGALAPLPPGEATGRRLLSLRCYANPDLMLRLRCRSAFVRAGFQVVDCPPLTAAGKNSADIHMVLDAVDLLSHPTRFDEFIILSADADFTPLLSKLRLHDRHTVVFSSFETAGAYKAVAGALLRIETLIAHLAGESEVPGASREARPAAARAETAPPDVDAMVGGVKAALAASSGAIALAAAAQAAAAAVGNATGNWGGAGAFARMMEPHLGSGMQISKEHDVLYDPARHTLGTLPVALPTAAAALPEELRDLSLRLRSVLDCPILAPEDMRRVFDAAAACMAGEEEFDLNRLSKAVRDRLREGDRPIARGPVSFILKGVQIAGIDPRHLRSAGSMAAAYAVSLVASCRTAGVDLTPEEIGLMHAWFGAEPTGDGDNSAPPPPSEVSAG